MTPSMVNTTPKQPPKDLEIGSITCLYTQWAKYFLVKVGFIEVPTNYGACHKQEINVCENTWFPFVDATIITLVHAWVYIFLFYSLGVAFFSLLLFVFFLEFALFFHFPPKNHWAVKICHQKIKIKITLVLVMNSSVWFQHHY